MTLPWPMSMKQSGLAAARKLQDWHTLAESDEANDIQLRWILRRVAVTDPGKLARAEALKALSKTRVDVTAILLLLLNALKDRDADVRAAAADALGQERFYREHEKMVRPDLTAALKDTEADVRRSVVCR